MPAGIYRTKRKKEKAINIKIDRERNKKFDLIFSNFFCQLTSDFEKLIKNIFQILNSNGFFIATIPSSNNIYQLVNAMYETDNIIYGGMYQRINPVLETNDIGKSPAQILGLEDSMRHLIFICGIEGTTEKSQDKFNALIDKTFAAIKKDGFSMA